jgi:hypothetical protein
VTASFGTLDWPHFGFARPGFKSEKLRSAHFPASSRGVLKGPKSHLGQLRTVCADVLDLSFISRNGLLYDHRIAAAIHLRNRLPCS